MIDYEKCRSCKYFKEHYIISGTILTPIDGHCLNEALNAGRKRNKYRLYENCAYWEINSEVTENKVKSIKSVLNFMREHLSHIDMILTRIDKDREK